MAAAFVAAAVVGTLARAEAGRRWNRHNDIAVGTLVVNVTGSFLLGLLSEATPTTMTVLGVGGLGAYTTFSSFARDAVALVELRRLARLPSTSEQRSCLALPPQRPEWQSPTRDDVPG
jgi:fluoride ion exporter CrcB/FEX